MGRIGLEPRIRHTRPAMYRVMQIHRMLESGRCPGVPEMAERLEVSRRTVERDLEFLRDQLDAPLTYDRFRRGFRYERPYTLPTARLTAGELAVLLIGQRLLADMAGTPLAAAAQQVVEKLPLLLDGEVSVDLNPLSGVMSFGLPRIRGDEERLALHFATLTEAISQRRTVTMRYYAATRDEASLRDVDPYHLRCEAGAWYVIGYCHLRGELRTLAVDRILDMALTEREFELPRTFSIEEYLGHSWGIEHGREYLVRVAFDRQQARWVRERVWQEGQVLEDRPDGGVILQVRASGLDQIKRWILGFGRHARVLEPEELARAVREEAEGILSGN